MKWKKADTILQYDITGNGLVDWVQKHETRCLVTITTINSEH